MIVAGHMTKTKEKNIQPLHFINRELSWLEFNARVLQEAVEPANPVLERVKFFTIFSSNLDEFFEVRVAGLKQQMESEAVERSVDGLTPREAFNAVTRRIRELVDTQYAYWREQLVPALAQHHIHFLSIQELAGEDKAWMDQYYQSQIRPVLTPLAVDPAHPFP
jgi:polyphosphate kinase